jgi:hypothetical protein
VPGLGARPAVIGPRRCSFPLWPAICAALRRQSYSIAHLLDSLLANGIANALLLTLAVDGAGGQGGAVVVAIGPRAAMQHLGERLCQLRRLGDASAAAALQGLVDWPVDCAVVPLHSRWTHCVRSLPGGSSAIGELVAAL